MTQEKTQEKIKRWMWFVDAKMFGFHGRQVSPTLLTEEEAMKLAVQKDLPVHKIKKLPWSEMEFDE